jgi:hypothetical protein
VALSPHLEGAASMTKEVFEAFEGQQENFGYSQAVKVGDTIYEISVIARVDA